MIWVCAKGQKKTGSSLVDDSMNAQFVSIMPFWVRGVGGDAVVEISESSSRKRLKLHGGFCVQKKYPSSAKILLIYYSDKLHRPSQSIVL